MLDRTPYLQFIAPRIGRARDELVHRIWTLDSQPLPVSQSAPTREHQPIAKAANLTYRPVSKLPHHWGQMFEQCFWRVDLSGRNTKGRYLCWMDQGEATVYRDGVPLFGFDPAHKYQPLPDRVKELTIESICCRSGIWVTGETQGITSQGSRFEGAFLADRDDTAWRLYHDVEVLLQVAVMLVTRDSHAQEPLGVGGYRKPFESVEPLAKRILTRLDAAIDHYERGDLPAAAKASTALLHDLSGDGDPTVTNVLNGHAHIDLVWLWPENVANFKATHSLANALSLMDRYPEFIFGYSQPASYDAIDRSAPKLMQSIGKQVKTGRFEHAGATYVESDTQLPCGENLLRAFEVGQDDLRRRFGGESDVLWIPDVFGYSPCIPQIMLGFGVKYFYTTKQHWSSATQFPFSSFRWQGHDGSEVLTHVSFSHYNQTSQPSQHRFFANEHRQAGVHDEVLMPTGHGDGGGGPTAEMLERARRLADLRGMPRTRWGRIDTFFHKMAKHARDLPVWRGEIYLEYHRGVQTTHGRLKDAFRAAERGMQTWEATHAALGKGPVDLQRWKRLIFAQFHDYIPGTSIQRVYDEGIPELNQIADDARNHAATSLAQGDGQACLFNPLPLPVTRLVASNMIELPALRGVVIADAKQVEDKVKASKNALSNDRVKVKFNSNGEITSLRIDGQDIAARDPLAQVWTFPDMPNTYDAWDIDRHTLSAGTREKARAEIEVSGNDDATASITFTRNIARCSVITIRFTLEAGSPVLRIDTTLDWNDAQTLLKLVFPTDYEGVNARYGAPFGSSQRPQHPGPLANEAKFEVPGSRWAAVADDTEAEGLMVMTESRYGFGCINGMLHISLLRSAKITQPRAAGDTNTFSTTNGHAGEVSDLGKQTIRLAVGRFRADAPRTETPAALAETLFTDPVPYTGEPVDAGFLGLTGGDSLIPAWVKPTDDGYLIRLHETLGRRGRATLELADGYRAALTDLRGEGTSRPTENLTVTFRPYQLLTIRVQR